MKKLIAVILVLVMCFVMTACVKPSDKGNDIDSIASQTETKNETLQSGEATPLLYKVTDKNGNVAWLFGSVHVGDDYFYPLPDYVFNALDNADSLAVEFDIVAFSKDQSATINMLTKYVIKDGRKINDMVSEDLYEDAKLLLLENGGYVPYLDYYLPVLWSDFVDEYLFEKIGAKIDLGIDRHLINYAYEKKIEVLDIESADFQFNMMVNFSEELQELLLRESVESYKNREEVKKEFDELLYAWASGNEKKLVKLLSDESEFDAGEEKLFEEYNNAMLVERNINMADWTENALKSGKKTFICVGAAHIVGPGAMVELLKQRGYTVETVS